MLAVVMLLRCYLCRFCGDAVCGGTVVVVWWGCGDVVWDGAICRGAVVLLYVIVLC